MRLICPAFVVEDVLPQFPLRLVEDPIGSVTAIFPTSPQRHMIPKAFRVRGVVCGDEPKDDTQTLLRLHGALNQWYGFQLIGEEATAKFTGILVEVSPQIYNADLRQHPLSRIVAGIEIVVSGPVSIFARRTDNADSIVVA